MERGPDCTPPTGDDLPTITIRLEYFALVSNDLYVEMHDPRRVGRPMYRTIVLSCLTTDISYAAYLKEELRRWDGIESQIVRVDLTVARTPGTR